MYVPSSTTPARNDHLMPRPGDTSPGGMSTGMMGASPSGMTGRHDRLNSSTHSISASSFSAAAKKEQIARLRQRREFLARVDLLSRQNAAAGKPPVAPSPRGTPRDSIGGTLRDEDKPSGVDAGTETEVSFGVVPEVRNASWKVPESRPESAQTDELDLISRKTQTEPVFEKTAKHTDEDYEGLEKRLEEAENDASEKRKRNEESEALLADMTGKLRAAEEDRDRMRIEMQEMERAEPDQSMFEEREQELSDSLRNAEQTIFRLRAEVRELKAQKNALNFELDHLKSSPLSPRSVSSDSPRSPRAPDYPDLRSELEVEKNKSSGLAQELQQLRQEVVALRNERTELTENLSREQQRSEQADKALEDAKSRSAAQEQEIAEKSQKLAEMEKINADRPPLPPSSTVTVRTPEPPEASLPAPAPTVASESLETSSLLAAPRKPSNFSSDSCEVADEGITDDVRTAEVSNEDTLKKHSSEAKLAAASKSAEASPIAGQKPDVAGRQTPPDDFWGDAAASPVTGHGISNTGNAAVFAISTPDADSSHPKNAQGSSVSFSPVTAGGKEGRSDSIKSGAKQNKGTADAGDTSFTRRATGVATLFEDDEISTAAIFGGNANGEALDFDSILNSEPSSPFPGAPRPAADKQYSAGQVGNVQGQPSQPQPGGSSAPAYGGRSAQSSGYSSAANSRGSWAKSSSSWNYVEQQQQPQQQQSPYTSSSSGGSFPAPQHNSPYPTSIGGPRNTQQQGWGARPAQQVYSAPQQQQARWQQHQQPNTPPQNGVGLRPYQQSKPGFGGLQRR